MRKVNVRQADWCRKERKILRATAARGRRTGPGAERLRARDRAGDLDLPRIEAAVSRAVCLASSGEYQDSHVRPKGASRTLVERTMMQGILADVPAASRTGTDHHFYFFAWHTGEKRRPHLRF